LVPSLCVLRAAIEMSCLDAVGRYHGLSAVVPPGGKDYAPSPPPVGLPPSADARSATSW